MGTCVVGSWILVQSPEARSGLRIEMGAGLKLRLFEPAPECLHDCLLAVEKQKIAASVRGY